MLTSLLPLFALSTLSTFVSAAPSTPPPRRRFGISPRQASNSSDVDWSLERGGETGVAAMQIAVVSEDYIVIVDKVERNELRDSRNKPAWSALYDITKDEPRALNMETNSFCAGGGFISNGSMINIGGDPLKLGQDPGHNSNGIQGVRILDGCEGGPCRWVESPGRIRLAVPRWYASVMRLPDGSLLIVGGMTKGGPTGFINALRTNQPSFEYYPPRGDGLPIHSDFLEDSLNSNLFPIAFVLPNGLIFMAANNMAMLYDPETNEERRLPPFPKGVSVTYPRTGTGVLLPLSEENDWKPEILICGGSSISETLTDPLRIKSTDPSSDLCFRMILTNEEIEKGWREEKMPHAWMMPDAVTLPNGKILFINGCSDGVAGYGNVGRRVGNSNCANAVYQGMLYDPAAPSGSRFSSEGIPTSNIARGYHSAATLIPDGRIFIAGSNPNEDVTRNMPFATEYRVEYLSPPYLTASRPTFNDLPAQIEFGSTFELETEISMDAKNVKIALMDLGFITHSVHMNARLVYLPVTVSDDRKTLNVSAPMNGRVYPPGPGFVFVVVDGVPSSGKKVMVGDGSGPEVDEAAIESLLVNTPLIPL